MLNGIKFKIPDHNIDLSSFMTPPLKDLIPLPKDPRGIVIDYCRPEIIVSNIDSSVTYVLHDQSRIYIRTYGGHPPPLLIINGMHIIEFAKTPYQAKLRIIYRSDKVSQQITPKLVWHTPYYIEFLKDEFVVSSKFGRFVITVGKKATWLPS